MTNQAIAIDVGAKGSLSHIKDNIIVKLIRFDKEGLLAYRDYLASIPNFIPIIVERVNAMPRQGVASMFSFGERFGEVNALLTILEKSYEVLRPTDWQKMFCKATDLNLDRTLDTKGQIGLKVYNIFKHQWLLKRTGSINTDLTDSIAMAYAYIHHLNNGESNGTRIHKRTKTR